MKIRFSEHIPPSHREGILGEIEGMGATPQRLDEDEYFITFPKSTRYSFVVEFLRDEQRIGNLEFDESFLT